MATKVFTDDEALNLISNATMKTVVADYSPSGSSVVLANATSGNINVTLPSPSVIGITIEVKKTDASVNTVTLTPSSGTIDGQSSIVLTDQYMGFTVVADGTNWHGISSFSGSYT